jgi:hypothetical protein
VSAAFCRTCGTPRKPGAAFCSTCGARFDAPSPPSPPAVPLVAGPATPPSYTAPPAAAQPAAIRIDRSDLLRRARDIWFPLVLVGILGYIDYLSHGNLSFVLIGGVVSIAVILFRGEISKRLGLGDLLKGIPKWVRPVLVALPAMLWFVIRDQGTSGAGLVVMLTTLAFTAGVGAFGPVIDQRLRGFYAARNQMLPRGLRMLLTVVLPILLGFWIVHGTLAALPVLFQGSTSSPATASGRTGLFFLSTVVSAFVAFLLMREARGGG